MRTYTIDKDALTVNLMRSVGIDKHQARECADVVLQMLAAPSTSPEAIYQYQLANGNWIDQTKEMYDHLIKRGGSTVRTVYLSAPSTSLDTLTAENEKLRAALAEYARAGVGNSTDWHIQLSALRMATAIKGGA